MILVLVLYRPGSVTTVPKKFFEEFADLLERTATYASSLIITRDVNIHWDVPSGRHPTEWVTCKFNYILDTYNLVQPVTGTAHKKGHTLNIIDCAFIQSLSIRRCFPISLVSLTCWCRRTTPPFGMSVDVGARTLTAFMMIWFSQHWLVIPLIMTVLLSCSIATTQRARSSIFMLQSRHTSELHNGSVVRW